MPNTFCGSHDIHMAGFNADPDNKFYLLISKITNFKKNYFFNVIDIYPLS